MTKPTSASVVAALLLGIALGASAATNAPASSTKLYKWVDDKGETHYGEVIPPEYADKSRVQLDAKGRPVKQKDATAKPADDAAALEQRRKDKALLNTYSNEKEIDLARDRNLQQIEARISSIKLLQQSAQESLDGYNKEANGLKQTGKPIPASLQSDIATSQGKLEKLKQDLVTAQEKGAAVRASFEADKTRYRELTGAGK